MKSILKWSILIEKYFQINFWAFCVAPLLIVSFAFGLYMLFHSENNNKNLRKKHRNNKKNFLCYSIPHRFSPFYLQLWHTKKVISERERGNLNLHKSHLKNETNNNKTAKRKMMRNETNDH